MELFDWEYFEDFINNGFFEITDAGPLHTPIRSFSFKRNSKLKIVLRTTADFNASSSATDHPPGTVRINKEAVSLTSLSGAKAKITGITTYSSVRSANSKTGVMQLQEKSIVSSLEAEAGGASVGKYTIEWLENVDDSNLIWPHSVDSVTRITKDIAFNKESDHLTFKASRKNENHGRRCVEFKVGDHTIFFGVTGGPAGRKNRKRGFVIYQSCPDEGFRRKIRDCISFIIGQYLVCIGHTVLSEKFELVALRAVSAHSMDGRAFDIYSMPPTHLGGRYHGEIAPDSFSHMVNSIFSRYDEYNFGSLSWIYWHAASAPAHAAAVQFGAAIEALQRSYVENNGRAFQNGLISKEKWKGIRALLLGQISDLDDSVKTIFENKINGLNQLPKSVLTEIFLKALGVVTGPIENAAWQQRNDAAHGNEVEGGDYVKLIRNIKVLRGLFNRMALSIFGMSRFYYDYYSLNLPIRALEDPIPDSADVEQSS